MGSLSLNLPETLHRQLMMQAESEGVALDQYLVYLLAQKTTGYSVHVASQDDLERQKVQFARLLEDLGPTSYEQVRTALDSREEAEPEAQLDAELVGWLEKNVRGKQP